MKKISRKTKAEAITQILILVIGIIAISWMIGSEIGEVSAEDKTVIAGSRCGNGGICATSCNGDYNEKINGNCGSSLVCCKSKNNNFNSGTISTLISNVGAGVGIWSTINQAKNMKAAAELAKAGEQAAQGVTSTLGNVLTTSSSLVTPSLPGGAMASEALDFGLFSNFLTYISPAIYAGIAFIVGRYILGPWLGLNVQQSQALGWGLSGAALTASTLTTYFGTSMLVGGLIGAAVGFALFVILAKKSSTDLIQLTCYEWDSQSGAGLTETQMKERCEACNKQGNLGCTEYQCRSLGQGCMLIGDIGSGNELCIWNNTKDITPPLIKAWKDALKDNFTYTPNTAMSPPDTGVKVIYTGDVQVTTVEGMKCAPPYTPVSFGVELDEPARCKINTFNLANYSVMADMYMGSGIRNYTHSFSLSLPSKEAMEAANITVDNGGKYELFVRCQDANGNSNIGNFVFKFCISEGPDLTAPNILGTSILNNSPIGFGQTSVNLSLYTNEPSDCKWSHLDKSYDTMEENMTCDKSITEYNANLIYTCRTNLTGLKNAQDNRFYFKCRDNSSNHNTNAQSYLLDIIGTRPLIIDEVSPANGTTIEDSTENAKVELTATTSAGYQEGKAICSFSESGNPGTYVDFFYGNEIEPYSQHEHTQELWLGEGSYTYYIRCRDMGGNIDDTSVIFNVRIDKDSPMVVRVYKEDENLKVVTDEPGTCVYSTGTYGCNYLFQDGIELNQMEDKEFYTEWNTNIDFYIKCQDEYGNQPNPDECSIIARPFEIVSLQ
jgi:gas vesicle protein